MAVTLEPQHLHQLHDVLERQTELREKIDRAPYTIRVAESQLSQQEKVAASIREKILATKKLADGKQAQLSEREQRIERLTVQRNSCESNREFQLLSDQISADQQANEVLQDEILEQLEKLDALNGELEQADVKLAEFQEHLAEVRQRTHEKVASLNNDLADVEKELAENLRRLPSDVRAEVTRLAKVHGEHAVVSAENRSCGHCSEVINTQTYSELLMRHVVYCQSCGSLLYMMSHVATSD